MKEGIVIESMRKEFFVWRCLHGGPVSQANIDRCPSEPINCFRQRNLALLAKLTRTYGACAILARAGKDVVGHLRFYPKAVWEMKGAGEFCLQQEHPYGPADDFAEVDLPSLPEIEDKTLSVHCLMMGSPQQKENPYQRKGIGSGLVRALVEWARARGWEHIEAKAFEDLPIVYEITGSAGRAFWGKLGFKLVERKPHPYLQTASEFVTTLEEQAKAAGISPERAKDELLMRLDL